MRSRSIPPTLSVSSEGQLGRIILVIAAFCFAKQSVDQCEVSDSVFHWDRERAQQNTVLV